MIESDVEYNMHRHKRMIMQRQCFTFNQQLPEREIRVKMSEDELMRHRVVRM
jgi:hypothetical protein